MGAPQCARRVGVRYGGSTIEGSRPSTRDERHQSREGRCGLGDCPFTSQFGVFFADRDYLYTTTGSRESTTALASPLARTAMGRRLAGGFPDLVRSRHPGGRRTLRPILDLALSPSGCTRSRCHRCAEGVVGDALAGTSPASSAAALAGTKTPRAGGTSSPPGGRSAAPRCTYGCLLGGISCVGQAHKSVGCSVRYDPLRVPAADRYSENDTRFWLVWGDGARAGGRGVVAAPPRGHQWC